MEMLEVKRNDRKHTQSMALIDDALEFDRIAEVYLSSAYLLD